MKSSERGRRLERVRVSHCDLEESAKQVVSSSPSWQCQISIMSSFHRANIITDASVIMFLLIYNYSGPFEVFCVHYVYIMCTLCVHYVYIMCTLCVHYVYIMCTLCVHYVYIMCTLCVHYVYIMCTLCVHYVYIMCTLCVHYGSIEK